MLDLNNFIISSQEITLNTQESLEAALSPRLPEDLENEDNPVDPSSFLLLFTEILTNDLVKNEEQDQPESTEIDELVNSDIQLHIANPQMNRETQADEIGLQNKESLVVANNSDYQNPISDKPPLNILENNVAMTWINSEGYQPPKHCQATNAVFAAQELPEVTEMELDEDLVPEKFIDNLLKKEITNSKPVVANALDKHPENTKPVFETIATDTTVINTKEDLLKSLNSLAGNTPITIPDSVGEEQVQAPTSAPAPGIENLAMSTLQNVVQQGTVITQENNNLSIHGEAPSLEISMSINNTQWADEFSEQIIWLGNQGIKSAIIKISPDDLGPLEISIKVVKDMASVNISSHNSHVRDIVDQSLPRLKEMMAEQGLHLAEVHVGSDTNSRQFARNAQQSEEGFVASIEEEVQVTQLTKRTHQGVIDFFA